MNTCRTCRHWSISPYHTANSQDRDAWESGICWLAESTMGERDHPHSKAVALDADAYDAWLLTKPDFGCVQHQSITNRQAA